MSILVWVRDKLFGKPKVETPVNPQITDAVTQTTPIETAPIVVAGVTGSLAVTATAAAASTKKPTKSKKSAAKAKKTK